MKKHQSPITNHKSLITSHQSPFTNHPFLFIGVCFLVWRLVLLITAAAAPLMIPVFGAKFPYWKEVLLQPYYEPWFWVWGNFDGVHYLRIAKDGYFAEFSQAFFPLYPVLVGLLSRLFANEFLVAGFLISNFAFVAGLYFLFKLIFEEFSFSIAAKTIILLLIFPTSFYFGSIYTEGLFLLEILATFYFAKKGKWLTASLFGFFASLTRFVGVFLFPALLLEYYLQNRQTIHHSPFTNHWPLITKAAPLLLIPTGLAIYVIYLAIEFGNPFYFFTAQPVFGAQRTAGEIVLLPQVFWRYLKILFTVNPLSLAYFNAAFEFLVTLVFGILILVSFFKTRISWAAFSALAFLIPTLTGTFSSMPRYVLVSFPAFLVLAQIKNKLLIGLIIFVSCLLLLVSTILFVRGYWIA